VKLIFSLIRDDLKFEEIPVVYTLWKTVPLALTRKENHEEYKIMYFVELSSLW